MKSIINDLDSLTTLYEISLPMYSELISWHFFCILSFLFIFLLFYFLFLEQLGLGLIGHTVTSVMT